MDTTMARPQNPEPTFSVKALPTEGTPTAYSWAVYFVQNGVPTRKQGKVSVARNAKERQLRGSQKFLASKAMEAATDAAKEYVRKLKDGGTAICSWTVESWCRYCCRTLLSKRASVDYAKMALGALELHVFPTLGYLPLPALTAEQVDAWLEWRTKTPSAPPIRNREGEIVGAKKAKVLGWKTIDTLLGYFRTCMAIAAERRHVQNNPVASVARSKEEGKRYRTELKAQKRWFAPDELRRLRSESRGTIRAVVLVATDLAVRVGEACGVRLDQVDDDSGWVRLETQLRRRSADFDTPSRLAEASPKGDGARLLHVSAELVEFVKMRRAEEMLKPESQRCPYVVVSPEGTELDPNRAGKMFRVLCDTLEISLPPGNATHALRRSVLNLARFVPVKESSRAFFAGHDRIEHSDPYFNLTDEDKRDLALIARQVQARMA